MTIRSPPFVSLALGAVMAAFIDTSSAAAAPNVINCQQERSFHDLNGDGYVDAVVGDPDATVNDQVEAGTVTVLFGGADGRIWEGERRVLTQHDMGGTPQSGTTSAGRSASIHPGISKLPVMA